MRYLALEQGTPAWLSWRRQGVGASDATVLMGCDVPWPNPQTPRDLWLQKTARAPAQESTFAMRRGSRLEAPARMLYTQHTGIPVAPVCVEHAMHSWLRASLDGLDPWGEVVVEIKCPRKESHACALDGRVPDYYWPQVQHQLFVTGCPLLHYWSYSEHRDFGQAATALVEVRPDSAYQRKLLLAEWEFWARVLYADDWPAPAPEPAAALAS